MLDQDNIWKDKFNETSLDDQSWLEPDAGILDNIMQSVQSKPKKKYLLWFLVFLGLATIFGALSFYKGGDVLNKKTSTLLRSDFNSSEDKQLMGQKDDSEDVEEADGLNLMSSDRLDGTETISVQSKDAKQQVLNSSVTSFNSRSADNRTYVNNASLNTRLERKTSKATSFNNTTSRKTTSNNKNTFEQSKENFVSLENNKTPQSKNQIQDNKLSNNNTHSRHINIPTEIELLPTGAISFNNNRDILKTPVLDWSSPIDPINRQEKIYLGVVAGVSVWNFKLNNNYNTALNPADFRHDKGEARFFGFEFGYKLNEKLNFISSFGLEKVVFHSGHNSSLTYDSGHEQNNTPYNNYELDMATPMGFMVSDISILRASQEELPATDFIVDLNSTHKISNIDLAVGISYNVWQSDYFNVDADLLMGINNFSQVSNMLENFTVNHTDLRYADGYVSSNQQKIDHTTVYGGIGVRLVRHLSDSHLISLQMQYKANLQPIYSENDFSTDLSRLQIGFQFARKF